MRFIIKSIGLIEIICLIALMSSESVQPQNSPASNEVPGLHFSPDGNFQLTWGRVTWATGYEVQVDTEARFTAPHLIADASLPADQLFYDLHGLLDDVYYWRVRAKNSNEKWGNWTRPQSFEVSGVAIAIPEPEDWVDFGMIFSTGVDGEWDYYLYGGFAGSAIKHDGLYYLYYQGASGYQSGSNETVTGRAVGVAVSEDGIRYVKSTLNPVVTWSPNRLGEEGAVSSSVTVFGDQFVMLYGANTAINDHLVSANGRWAVSDDGIEFTDQGIALNHINATVWGYGDELFPVILIEQAGRLFGYYIPNGVSQRGLLGVGSSDGLNPLSATGGVFSGANTVRAWGPASYAEIAPGEYAVFLTDLRTLTVDAYTVNLDMPSEFSPLIQRYQFSNAHETIILLDRERRTWFMYYARNDYTGYGVRLAPAGNRDESPPTRVNGLNVTANAGQVQLEWNAASDLETGIAAYNVYRNGEHIATVKETRFQESMPSNQVTYTVAAVNFHNVEGQASTPRSP